MLTTMAKQESRLATEPERPTKAVLQDKSTIYQIKAEVLTVAIQAPIRPRQFVHVQQYYTGDA